MAEKKDTERIVLDRSYLHRGTIYNPADNGGATEVPTQLAASLRRAGMAGESVQSAEAVQGEPTPYTTGVLPSDFPHTTTLNNNGVETMEQLRAHVEQGTLTDLQGIGQVSSAEVEEAYTRTTQGDGIQYNAGRASWVG